MSRYGSDWCRYARVQVLCQASAACLDSANTADVNRDAQRLRNGSCASPRRGGACACDRSLHIFERGRPSVAANESYGRKLTDFCISALLIGSERRSSRERIGSSACQEAFIWRGSRESTSISIGVSRSSSCS